MFLKSKFTAVMLAGSVSLAALCGVAHAAPLTYSDMIKLDRINSFKLDPTGRYAVLSIRVTDMDKNKGVNSIWLKDLTQPTKPEIKLAVSEGGASNAQFGPDGVIYFISGRGEGGTDQVWKTDLTGAAATQATHLPPRRARLWSRCFRGCTRPACGSRRDATSKSSTRMSRTARSSRSPRRRF